MTTKVKTKSSFNLQRSQASRSSGFFIRETVIWVFLIAIALIELLPLSWMFSTSLRDPKDSFNLPPDFWPTAFHWQNYLAVINSPDTPFLSNSVSSTFVLTS